MHSRYFGTHYASSAKSDHQLTGLVAWDTSNTGWNLRLGKHNNVASLLVRDGALTSLNKYVCSHNQCATIPLSLLLSNARPLFSIVFFAGWQMVLASIYLLIVFLCAVGTRDDGNNNVGVSQPWGARSVSCTDSCDVSAVWYIGRNIHA